MSFIRLRRVSTSTVSNRRGIFTVGASSGTDVGSRDYPPREVTINQFYAHVAAAPGVGNSYTAQFKVAGGLTGPVLTISDAEVTDFVTSNVTLPAADLSGGAQIQNATAGAPATQSFFYGIEYTPTFPDSDICIIGAGNESDNMTMSGTAQFIGFEGSGTTADTTTESTAQCRWPVPGAFKFFSFAYVLGAGTNTAEVQFRKNGAMAATFTLSATSGSLQLLTDYTQIVSVAAGDLLCWRWVRTVGASTTFACNFEAGFVG